MLKQKRDDFKVYEAAIDYFDSNDLGEKLADVKAVEAEVNIFKRAFVINVKSDTAKQLLQIANDEGISSTMLLQRWLNEKLAEYTTGKGHQL